MAALRCAPGSVGSLIVTLLPADNAFYNSFQSLETHVMLIEWAYGGDKAGKHEVAFIVRELGERFMRGVHAGT